MVRPTTVLESSSGAVANPPFHGTSRCPSVTGEGLADARVIAVAIGAFREGIFVDDHLPLADGSGLRVAFGAKDVGVAAGEREMGPGVVVECGWRPVLRIVAIGTMGFVVLDCGELTVVNVVVAGFALLGRACKARGVVGGGFVALCAGDGAMRADKRKFRFGVVEAGYIQP